MRSKEDISLSSDYDNQIRFIQYEKVALRAQQDVYQTKPQQCEDIITHLKACYIYHARDLGKDNIIMINVRKHTISANDKYHDLPYYISRIQHRKRHVKLRWHNQHFPDHETIVEIDSPNRTHAFNEFEEEGHVEQKYNNFRLIDLTQEELYTIGVPAIHDENEEEIFMTSVGYEKPYNHFTYAS